MDVASRRDTGAAVGLSERQSELTSGGVEDRARVNDPVVLGGVAVEVRCVREDAREVVERVL